MITKADIGAFCEAVKALGALINEFVADAQVQAGLSREFAKCNGELGVSSSGLLGYSGLAGEFAVDGKPMSERSVKRLAARHRKILKPVKLGHRTVGFRRADVERLKSHLAGEIKPGGLL